MKQIRKIIQTVFYSKNARTQLVKRNVVGITLLKGVSVLTTFLLVPMTINYLNPIEYGIWLTLNSILTWANVFDFGLGHGLRNKIAEAYAVDDVKKVRTYVSTAFLVLSILSLLIFLTFYVLNHFIKWDKLLNIDLATGDKLSIIALWVMFFFCIQFVVRIIGTITMADQRPMLGALINVVGNIFVLFAIGLLTYLSEGSLLYVAIVFSAIPVVTYIVFSYLLFRTRYKNIMPSLKWIEMKCMKDIVNLGGKFFIIQVSAILIFASSNVIISNVLGPNEVTIYNIAYKYFSVVTLLFTIITTPLWSAFTDAYVKNDLDWIKMIIERMQKLWMLSVLATFVLLLLSDLFYTAWVGNTVKIPLSISVSMAIYVIVYNFHCAYIFLINGIGKVFIQWVYSLLSFVLYLPLAIYFCRLFGVVGIVYATVITLFPLTICTYIQCKKIVLKQDTGIWAK